MNCRLCATLLTPSNTCRAHIFPRSLLKLLGTDGYGRLMVIGTSMERSMRMPIGSYDTNILCANCDNKIGIYDEYARSFIESNDLVRHSSNLGWIKTGVDQHKLKMFCISYLWRASITRRPEFRRVNLGKVHEERVRVMIQNDNSGGKHDYTVSLQKFSNEDSVFGGILFPARTRLAGVNCYEGYLPHGYKFWVKVDSRNEDTLSGFSVGAAEPLFIGDRGNFRSSQEKSIMVRAARRSK